jgi:hypothetical protein
MRWWLHCLRQPGTLPTWRDGLKGLGTTPLMDIHHFTPKKLSRIHNMFSDGSKSKTCLLRYCTPKVRVDCLTAVVMNSTIFWDITPCSTLKVNRHFGGIYRLHLQSRKISRARYQRKSRWQAKLDPEDGGVVPHKRRLNFNGLYYRVLYHRIFIKQDDFANC